MTQDERWLLKYNEVMDLWNKTIGIRHVIV